MEVLILHGYLGNSPEHWQTWLAGRLGDRARYPALPDPEHPRLDAWLAALDVLRPAGEHLVVAHSLSCLLWLHHLHRGGRPARALLVSPPCSAVAPEIAGFFPAPSVDRHAPGSRLVCSDDDPFCADRSAPARYGAGLEVDVLPGQGHLNATAGYGPWPEVEAWCAGQDSAITSSRIAPG
jgi:predicted alpha/beta hydrolase family esterase